MSKRFKINICALTVTVSSKKMEKGGNNMKMGSSLTICLEFTLVAK